MNKRLRTTAHATWRVTLCLILAVGLLSPTAHAVYTDSIFSKSNYYPRPWWAVSSSDISQLANNALTLRTDAADPKAFSQDIILGLARNQRTQVSHLQLSLSFGESHQT